jgi:hypothetical protein
VHSIAPATSREIGRSHEAADLINFRNWLFASPAAARSSALDGRGRARSDAVAGRNAHRCRLAARPSPPCHPASARAHNEIGDMRTDHQILHHEARVALEARPGRGVALTVFSSWIVSFDFVSPRLPPPSPGGLSGFGSVAFSLGLIFGRRGPPFRRAIQRWRLSAVHVS